MTREAADARSDRPALRRYANPMNDNAVLSCARGLIGKFNAGVLPGDARLRGRNTASRRSG